MEETERLQQWATFLIVFVYLSADVCCSVMAIWKQLPVHCSFRLSCVERFRFTALPPPVLTTLVMSCRGIDPSIFGVESLASQYWHLRKIKVLIPDLVSAIQTQIGLRQNVHSKKFLPCGTRRSFGLANLPSWPFKPRLRHSDTMVIKWHGVTWRAKVSTAHPWWTPPGPAAMSMVGRYTSLATTTRCVQNVQDSQPNHMYDSM